MKKPAQKKAAPKKVAAQKKSTAPAKKQPYRDRQGAEPRTRPSSADRPHSARSRSRYGLVVAAPPAGKPARRAASDLDTVSWWEDFYRVVRAIPRGRVTTYGVVAAFGGHPRAARHVGYAMAALKSGKNRDVPWQRVLGAAPRNRAKVTIKDPIGGAMQRALLEAEGVRFDALGRVDLGAFGWKGPAKRARGLGPLAAPSRSGPGQRNRAKSSARVVTPKRR